jgi:nucleoid-associated protein YgaU
MPVGKKLVVVASVLATGACAAFFFRKDASQVAGWQEAQENSPFRERVERRVAADAAWAKTPQGTRVEAALPEPPTFRVPTAETAAISQSSPLDTPSFQKSLNPVGALLEPIQELPAELADGSAEGDLAVGGLAPAPLAHKIADGDTLSKLAQRYLGRGDRYLEIYELNRDVLTSPDLLPIGVVLKIPPAQTPPGVPRDPKLERIPLEPPPDMVPIDRQSASVARPD